MFMKNYILQSRWLPNNDEDIQKVKVDSYCDIEEMRIQIPNFPLCVTITAFSNTAVVSVVNECLFG
jgi:hypothetical protein